MVDGSLCFLDAVELARLIRAGEVSAWEVMHAHLAQIERVNPAVNAVVTLVADRALAWAREADDRRAHRVPLGPLHGLPVAHKDLVQTQGIRTTMGSLVFKDFIPDEDQLIVTRLRDAGAITIGKTNTPEFGAGSQTFNKVFGATRNPYDLSRTCGGSSGGAAVALACGMVPIADGSDLGGSLRNPANFCNIVGLRPSAGRVPAYPNNNGWYSLSVLGPMARTVRDVALMFSAIAGPDARAPISLEAPGSVFAPPLERDFRGRRIAFSADFGKLIPVDPAVVNAIAPQRSIFASLGCVVEEAIPDFTDANEIFHRLRAYQYESNFGAVVDRHPDLIKDTVIWNIEEGRKLSGPELAAAERMRTVLFRRVHAFFEKYEFLVLPVSQVLPFDIDTPYVQAINGVPMQTYIDWMRSCIYITVTGHPAISVPCGFSPEGLPVGLQIVGRYRDDRGVLELAHAFEQATRVGERHPPIAV
ncbi:MAG: amidase [Betaproteobacteria bacterium]|nr:amidase [Betaproteobacteria bacterium]